MVSISGMNGEFADDQLWDTTSGYTTTPRHWAGLFPVWLDYLDVKVSHWKSVPAAQVVDEEATMLERRSARAHPLHAVMASFDCFKLFMYVTSH